MSYQRVSRKAGATSQMIDVFIEDSAQTDNRGKTGLAFNTASLIAYYHLSGGATATAITLADATVGTFTSGGFKEIDATHMPGWYQIGIPNAALASGTGTSIQLSGATGMKQTNIHIDLTANADVNSWLGTTVATPATAGVPSVDAIAVNNVATTSVTTVNANIGTTQPVNYSGTGASANVKTEVQAYASNKAPMFSGVAMTESYSTAGAARTPEQALYEICQTLQNRSVSAAGTTLTVKKLDGSTSAMTFTVTLSNGKATAQVRAS